MLTIRDAEEYAAMDNPTLAEELVLLDEIVADNKRHAWWPGYVSADDEKEARCRKLAMAEWRARAKAVGMSVPDWQRYCYLAEPGYVPDPDDLPYVPLKEKRYG